MKKESEQSRKRERERPGRKVDRQTDRQREMERLDFQVERFSIKSSHLLMGAEKAKRRGSSQLSQRLQSANPSPQKEGRRRERDEQEREKAQGRFLFSSPKDCNLPPPPTPGRREGGRQLKRVGDKQEREEVLSQLSRRLKDCNLPPGDR